MEGLSATAYRKMRCYWRRRGYERINGSRRTRMNRVELGGSGSTGRKRRFLRGFKIKPKLKFFKLASPKKFLVWLRDAYVKMMTGFANTRMVNTGYGGAIADGTAAFGRGPLKEYDEKMIVQIYKSLAMAQGQFGDGARIGRVSKLAAITE